MKLLAMQCCERRVVHGCYVLYPDRVLKATIRHVQSSQMRDTVVSGHCDTESLKRALQGFVEHGGIKVYIPLNFNPLSAR